MSIAELWFWGSFGLVIEITFTALVNLIKKSVYSRKEWNLVGHVSLWMFPVYAFGLTFGFDFVEFLIPNTTLRYFSYPFWVWSVELLIGIPASRHGIKIWSYEWLPDWAHYKEVISFVHFPLWILFGILVEFIRGF